MRFVVRLRKSELYRKKSAQFERKDWAVKKISTLSTQRRGDCSIPEPSGRMFGKRMLHRELLILQQFTGSLCGAPNALNGPLKRQGLPFISRNHFKLATVDVKSILCGGWLAPILAAQCSINIRLPALEVARLRRMIGNREREGKLDHYFSLHENKIINVSENAHLTFIFVDNWKHIPVLMEMKPSICPYTRAQVVMA